MTLGKSHVLAKRLGESTEPEARRDPWMRCQPLGEVGQIATGKLRRELALFVNQLAGRTAPPGTSTLMSRRDSSLSRNGLSCRTCLRSVRFMVRYPWLARENHRANNRQVRWMPGTRAARGRARTRCPSLECAAEP